MSIAPLSTRQARNHENQRQYTIEGADKKNEFLLGLFGLSDPVRTGLGSERLTFCVRSSRRGSDRAIRSQKGAEWLRSLCDSRKRLAHAQPALPVQYGLNSKTGLRCNYLRLGSVDPMRTQTGLLCAAH